MLEWKPELGRNFEQWILGLVLEDHLQQECNSLYLMGLLSPGVSKALPGSRRVTCPQPDLAVTELCCQICFCVSYSELSSPVRLLDLSRENHCLCPQVCVSLVSVRLFPSHRP